MPIYFKFAGIEGEATHANHKNWMEIKSLRWDVRREVKTLAGAAANREGSQPTVASITLTKTTDVSSTKLLQQACTGNQGKDATIDLVTSGNPGDTYIQYQLTNTIIDSYEVSSSGERPEETITLNFTKFSVKYTPYDESNQPGGPQIASYDLATAQAA